MNKVSKVIAEFVIVWNGNLIYDYKVIEKAGVKQTEETDLKQFILTL